MLGKEVKCVKIQELCDNSRNINMNKPKCNSCQENLRSLGQIGLRTGGTDGGWGLFVGDWADIGEKVLYFDLYRCESCGRLEFFDNDFSLPSR